VNVGVEAYKFGTDNDYTNPKCLFLGGLFHDIYRPADGQHGEEDQTPGASVVLKLFIENNLDQAAMNLISGAIKSHDGWRTEDSPPVFDLLLSLGDKAAHDTLLTDSYVWINNRRKEIAGENFIYTNHWQTLTSFYQYQRRAIDMITKYGNIKGIERPRYAYSKIVSITINRYIADPGGESFLELVKAQKVITEKWEREFLAKLGINRLIIDKILALYKI
jgi:hypothetical protein